jgi:hypothetical protein
MTSEAPPRITLQSLSSDVNNKRIRDMSLAVQGSSDESPAKEEQAAQDVHTYAVMKMPRNISRRATAAAFRACLSSPFVLDRQPLSFYIFLSIKE